MLKSQGFRTTLALALGLVAACLGGCGGSGLPSDPVEARDNSALSELGEAYRVYTITRKKPPTKLADLKSVEGIGGNGVASVQSGDILVQWGAQLPSTGEEPGDGTSSEVLAYWKTVPEKGGYVLMLDRSVKKMTADEFKAAPTPAGTSTATGAPAKKK